MLNSGPAYRIHTRRLVVRCFAPEDAAIVKEAIDESLDHLRPWVPWSWFEPVELRTKVEQLRRARGNFDLDRSFGYGIFDAAETIAFGGIGLHVRDEAMHEIGYWIRRSATGLGFATEVVAAMVKIAFEIRGVRRIEIRCDPVNLASMAIPIKLGFTHEETLIQSFPMPDGRLRDTLIFSLSDDVYPSTPSASASIEAFDIVGQKIL